MERKRNKHNSVLLWATMAALLAQNLVIPVVSSATFEDQKTHYSPDPRTRTPPTGSQAPPSHGSGGGHRTPTPSRGGESFCNCHNPPSGGHHHTTPSPPTGGGGGDYNPPPSSTPTTPTIVSPPTVVTPPTIGSPPTTPIDPGTPSIPSPPSGGDHRTPAPSPGEGSYGGTPPAGNCGNPPSGGHHHTTPSPPTGGGGGYYNPTPSSPPTTPTTPTPTILSPPTTPIDPGTPITPSPPTGGGGGYYNPTPSSPPTTPTILSPPTTPIDPGTPITPIDPGTPSIPSPPFGFDPNSPPFTCDYWRTHPGLIWGLFGWLGTVGGAFGVTSLPDLGSSTNLLQALSNRRPDGLGALYREGTAALLNSMVHRGFPYTTRQVRDSFAASLSSNNAATAQAMLFKQANEGRTKPGA